MPCYDSRDDASIQQEEFHILKKRVAWLEAALCMLSKKMYDDSNTYENASYGLEFYDMLMYKEAGISKESFVTWWKDHKKADFIRRTKELEQKKTEAAKQKLLATLSEEELRLLKIKI
jgi:hypothetical protein